MQEVLDTAIQAYRRDAAAQKSPSWIIEYGVAELTEDFQWWGLEVKDQNVPREPRLQKLLATKIRLFKEYAIARNSPSWQIESDEERIKEDFEWWKLRRQTEPRNQRLQRILDSRIRLFRAHAITQNWLPWQVESVVAEIKEDFEWLELGIKDQNVPREPRLQKVLETKIRLFREYAIAEKWPAWQLEYGVVEITEDFQWQKLGVKDQNIPREPRLQKLLETKIRLFRAQADLVADWPEWRIEYEVAEITEDFQWEKLGVKYQNVPREPRLQKLLETKIRLFRAQDDLQDDLGEDLLPWEIEYEVAEITEDFQWWKLGVKDQNVPREPRLQKLRELKVRLEREYNEQIARGVQEDAKIVQFFGEVATDVVKDYLETPTTDQRGLVTKLKYDPKGNVVERSVTGNITGDGVRNTVTTKYLYNENNFPIRVSDSLGNEIAAFYEDSRNPSLATRIERRFQGQTLFSVHNTYGSVETSGKRIGGLLLKQQIAVGTPDEVTVEYTYNEHGLLVSQKRITGNSDPDVVTEFEYNSRGELTKQIDDSGISIYIHDSVNKQIRMERRDKAGTLLASQTTHYNPSGAPNRIDQLGQNTAGHALFEYDGAGLLKSWKISGNQPNRDVRGSQTAQTGSYSITSYERDLLGNVTEIRHPNGDRRKMNYDPTGQILSHTYQKTAENSQPSTERFTYGPGGDIIKYTGPNGGETRYVYTAEGKLCRQENPDGTVQEWRYGLDGRLVKQIESDGSYWETAYNDIERTITRIRKDSSHATLSQESYAFDRRGNVISYTDGQKRTVTRQYDSLNRLKTEFGPSAREWNHISYGRNALMIINHLGEKQTFTKDALGRISKIVNQDANNQKIAEITYNYSGERVSITETKGSASTTTHVDPANWMTAIGKLGEGIFQGAVQGDYYNPSNTAQVIGKFIGQVGTSFVPGIAQTADIRDLSAAFNAGRTEGWNISTSVGVMAAGLAFVPLVGDIAKVGMKPLFGKSSVKALSNVTDSAFGGTPYSPQKLQQLAGYLERRGIQVMETGGNPAFIGRTDRTGTILLPRNPTELQVKHELSHYLDFRNLGFEAYRNLGRAGRERSVLERLQGNRIWGTMNEAEKRFSIDYATGIK